MTDKNNDSAPKPQLTRIPLEQVWFRGDEGVDFPGGNAIQHGLIFGPPKHKGHQYFLGYFVPSYQVVTVEYYSRGEEEPEVFDVPMSSVKKTKRAKKP